MVLDILYHVPSPNEINFSKANFRGTNFDMDLFWQIAKSRFFAWIYFRYWKNLFLKTFVFSEKTSKDKEIVSVDLCQINLLENYSSQDSR